MSTERPTVPVPADISVAPARGISVAINREEGWIHIVRLTDEVVPSIPHFTTRNEVHTYSDGLYSQWLALSHQFPACVSVFECKRVSP